MVSRFFLTGLLVILIFIIAVLSTPSFIPHFDIQTMRLYEMNRCFMDGQIPCRWAPDLGNKYGYPLFNYYAPLPFYIGEIFYLLSGSLSFSVKILIVLSLTGMYTFCYLLTRRIWQENKSAVVSIVYTVISYLAVTILLSGAPGELWSLMLLPGILWGITAFHKNQQKSTALVTALMGTFFILSHHISASSFLLFSPIVIIGLYFSQIEVKLIRRYLLFIIFSLLLSAFYWIPLVFESNLTHMGEIPWKYLVTLDRTGYNFLPVSTEKPPERPEMGGYKLLTGETEVIDFKSGTNWITFSANTKTHSIIRITQYYFPNWQLVIDGKQEKIEYENNNLGLITFIVSPGNHSISLKLIDTPVRIVANLLTLGGFLLYLFFLLIQFPRVYNWLTYYLKGLNR